MIRSDHVPELGGNNARRAIPSILAIDSSGSVTKANLPARKIFGEVQDNLRGRGLGSLLAQLLSRHRGKGSGEINISLKGHNDAEGFVVVLGENAAAVQDQASTGVSLEQAQSGKAGSDGDEVLDFIAHELRNHLSTILGLSEVLDGRYATMSPMDHASSIDGIRTEAERALLVLDGLLKLAESKARPDQERANVPLHSVIRRVIRAHRRRFPGRSFSIGGDSPLFAVANPTWVELALGNLLSNAEKVTPRDKPIEISLYQDGSRAVMLVQDYGADLAPEVYDSLWEIYKKGPRSGVRVSGSGIGLALCKELVEGMGGRVWAGPREHQGSVFAISLPVPEYALPPQPQPSVVFTESATSAA